MDWDLGSYMDRVIVIGSVSVQGRTSTLVPIFDQDLHTSPTVLDFLIILNRISLSILYRCLLIDRLIFAVITLGLTPGCTWSLCHVNQILYV